ncbi:MAG: hypothetical protein AAB215_05825 [Planctomycetota bacterium]
MNRTIRRLSAAGFLFSLLLTAGCASEGYFGDRMQDLTDVAHVDVTGLSVGVAANVGPVGLGAFDMLRLSDSLPGGARVKIGLGGVYLARSFGTPGLYVGLLFPIIHNLGDTKRDVSDHAGDWYGRTYPAWGSVGADVGVGLGLGARVDPIELADFLLGFGLIDLANDDVSGTK